jgi:hypothetical protein
LLLRALFSVAGPFRSGVAAVFLRRSDRRNQRDREGNREMAKIDHVGDP